MQEHHYFSVDASCRDFILSKISQLYTEMEVVGIRCIQYHSTWRFLKVLNSNLSDNRTSRYKKVFTTY